MVLRYYKCVCICDKIDPNFYNIFLKKNLTKMLDSIILISCGNFYIYIYIKRKKEKKKEKKRETFSRLKDQKQNFNLNFLKIISYSSLFYLMAYQPL